MTRRFVLSALASLLGICALSPAAAQSTGTFVQMSDTHIGKPASYETPEKMAIHREKVTRIIDEINRVIRPDFVLITGDTISVTDEESAKEFAMLLKRFTVPVYVVPGNHDDGSVRNNWFQKYVGPTRFVIDRKPWRVVAFDGRPLMENEKPHELLGWLRTELSKPRESGDALVVASHYPLHIPNRWEDAKSPRRKFQLVGANALHLNLLLGEAGANAYLAGHTHSAFEVDDPHTGIPCLVSGASQNGDYRICGWDGGMFSSARASEGKWPKIIVTRPRARLEGGSEFVSGTVAVRVLVFSPEPVRRVEMSVDGGEPVAMKPVAGGYWEADYASVGVKNGRHDIIVRAVSQEKTAESAFAVAVSNTLME